ncbi:hypothetical protein [Gulosibacter faecalis]|jgi:hypothetical protein|uniref:Uncharacterized protein n=1 Tax=Gulosibacter faecalis TaxID=272240 RepID=A0ABW5UVX4_9MICO|nr:hypothetical protein [Gulosibacter faecalis]
MTSNAEETVRLQLLQSTYVNEVLKVAIDAEERVVGVQFCLANLTDLGALPPLFAQLRADIKLALPTVEHVFLEPDVTERRAEEVPTENVVIRGWD